MEGEDCSHFHFQAARSQVRVRVSRLNVEGDQQSDLTVHGGPDKAVYAYPSEHYPFWRRELPGMDLAWGVFGENFTTAGLLEETVHIGDRLRRRLCRVRGDPTAHALL